jgi:hypothetical protein
MVENKFHFIPVYDENVAYTENGALSYNTSGSELADQFGKAGAHRGRSIEDVCDDQMKLWDENPEAALRFPFYLRMITRKTRIGKQTITENVQRGQGARDESFKRLLWIAKNHKDVFNKNIWILPVVGSWKDVWTLMHYDVIYDFMCIDRSVMFELINAGLRSSAHSELVKKFMPRIKASSKCVTDWTKNTNQFAKEFAKYNSLSYKEYNHLKTSGTAHEFQKLISNGMFNDINWKAVPGRALSILTDGKFLANHNLEETYTDWVLSQSTVKFTGYPFELARDINKYYNVSDMPMYKKATIDKQFEELIEKASDGDNNFGNVWCALDTSGSMKTPVAGETTAFDVCISLGIFFSTLNKGAFHKNVVMFDDESHTLSLKGGFCDMWQQINNERTAWGSTNFQSVIDLMCKVRKENPQLNLDDYPQTILVVSDMQFNPVDYYYGHCVTEEEIETNLEAMKRKLYEHFPSEFVDSMKFIWWQVNGSAKDVPATMADGGNYLISGFDGSIVTMLLGGEVVENAKKEGRTPTMSEIIDAALNQEVLQRVTM